MTSFFWHPAPEDRHRHVIAGHRCTLHGKQVPALCGQTVTIPNGPPDSDDLQWLWPTCLTCHDAAKRAWR
jgi:hypothetical protein